MDENTAYEILTMVMGFAGTSKCEKGVELLNSNPTRASEDLRYLQQEFDYLLEAGGGRGEREREITRDGFMEWEEIQSILSDGFCSSQDIHSIWENIAGDKESIGWTEFVLFNRELDDMFDCIDESGEAGGESDDEDEDEGEDQEKREESFARTGSRGRVIEVLDESDIWNPLFDPISLFDSDFVTYLTNFFNTHCDEEGLSFSPFEQWTDVKQMLHEGSVDQSCLSDLWNEALYERKEEKRSQSGKLSLDTFFRLNIRLDNVINEIQEALENLTDEEVEQYYRQEFDHLVSKTANGLLTYERLLEWTDMSHMLSLGQLPREELKTMWNALPKTKCLRAEDEGIDVDAFLALNMAIEDSVGSSVYYESPVDD